MYFFLLLLVLLVSIAVHFARSGDRSMQRLGALTIDYLLIGYCGLPQLVLAVLNIADPAMAPRVLGFPAGNPFQMFLGWAYLGMALSALLTLRYRDHYRIGPAVVWAVFFGGATMIHLGDLGSRGAMSHGDVLHVFGTHTLISLLLVAGLVTSGVRPGRALAASISTSRAAPTPG